MRGVTLLRYACAIVAAGTAALSTHALGGVLSSSLGLLFMAAVMLVALYGGLGPALVTSVLCASAFFLLVPHERGTGSGESVLQLAVFACVAVLISWLSSARRDSEEALRKAHAELEVRVQERTAALDAAVNKLKSEIAERRRGEAQILEYQDRLRSLATELSVSEEQERRRIAATLHDGVGHRLAVAVMKLRELLQANEGKASDATIARACELVEEAIEHTRSLTLQLSPPILFELGLTPALEWLATRIEADHGLRVHVVDLGTPSRLSDETLALLFSAIRELLINVVKHADAANAWVTTRAEEGVIEVEIEDDGKGCDSQAIKIGATAGFGLFNIRERLTHLNGQLDIASAPGKGCRVMARFPYQPAQVEARAT